MLPIDEDILMTRYGDDPIAAEIYQRWREMGADPQGAIQATDELIRTRDMYISPPPYSQHEILERYIDACGEGILVLQELEGFRSPTDEEVGQLRDLLITADPFDPEIIQALVEEARRFTALALERLNS